ncbi:peptidyl-prolyl isomerase cwc-27 [Neurospora crassa OR74A]|uniref:Peptidyl-prolyl isomerase cwc-27 n=1 Tax=Neurospora crassa (strain ATCC 24698 / 74-OR23-1A / CBS 708.71 / DSM 1257 / FGSC 987) TaxID=367110 RepID=CWC27_NEUCR|nr:peptidyl-prolyl isomerase cwc-27 [Neurospora crassa OR74A]Q7SBX8.1 RecName: Full=Peptidyl-prolyl isomerase cwc-27; Short=PPIase cwc-27; AltName: Full=Rotamase cwc-27 [Neurospora crassa OR74A]EAA33928.1 peptidyl-prolyl isomerase cwc-27 [Neurospora crassa OR74A]CAE75687.1 related to peptidylprolyl isomerase (cyclophilin)-like protein [Neurospora crassa]|eukprot:XP_963164.1 peptidyl-prolyl isomerase cwc-27 [Neurospora crassa OR74A]
MSAIYNLEPQPTASAIIHTTQGEIAVELFAKQTPLTCRNFLQLALDGYYDNTIFHRLIPGFIVQGGDPSGTGHGGESIYDNGALSGDLDPWPMDQRRGKNAGPHGVNFKDEFHSRLKFNRRGLLGMANEGAPDTNSSQFFFTLGKADELTGKNTMFGRVAGDTIYNLAKIGEAEVEEGGERPLYPIKITRIEILINPFDDMQKREKKPRPQQISRPTPAEKKQKKRKGGKQLLSFGDEVGDEDGEELPLPKKPKFDTRIVADLDQDDSSKQSASKKSSAKRDAKPVANDVPKREEKPEPKPVKESRRSPSPQPVAQKKEQPPKKHYSEHSSPEPEEPKKKSLLEKTNEEIAALKASMKRTIHSEPVKQEKKKSALEQLIPDTAIRGRKRRPGASSNPTREEQEALDLLKSFKAKIETAPPEKNAAQPAVNPDVEDGEQDGQADEEKVCDLHFIANCQSCKAWDKVEDNEDSGDEGWMSHKLSFAADKLGKDLSYRKKAEEELVVIDPLAKARTLKEEKKATRDAKTGGSSRAWDRGRRDRH